MEHDIEDLIGIKLSNDGTFWLSRLLSSDMLEERKKERRSIH